MRAKAIALFILILSAVSVSAGYVEIDLLEKTDNGFVSLGGKAGFGFTDHKESSGVFHKSKNSVGVATSMIDDNEDLIYEIIYDLYISNFNDEFFVKGVLYNHQFINDTLFSGGVRKYFDEKTNYGKPLDIPIGQSDQGIDLKMRITLFEKQPATKVKVDGLFAKQVISFNGQICSEGTNGKSLLEKKNNFRTSDSRYNPKTGKQEVFKYFSEILIEDLPDKITGPFTAVVKHLRTYEIDEDNKPNQTFNKTASYMSVYSESIRFIPGETVMLIFPPDEPSVGAWGVLDTIYLKAE